MGAGLASDNIVGELVGAAASVEAGRAASHVDGVPRWTMLAVTPTTLYAIACGQHGVGWQPQETFASFDRSTTRITVHVRVNVRTLTVEVPASERTYQWEGNRSGAAHALPSTTSPRAGWTRPSPASPPPALPPRLSLPMLPQGWRFTP